MVWAQEQRKEIVKKVISSLRLLQESELELDKEGLIATVMAEYGSTRRKAAEYIQEAQYILKHAKPQL